MTFQFQRYSRAMSNGGSIFARNGEALSDDQLRAYVPSIFATEAHESRSARFAPVPTATILEGLRREGFEPFSAQQAKTRVAGKSDYTKHMLRLRHRSTTNAAGQAFEIVLVNANDGTSSYQMIPGFFRMVCANGLICGDTFDQVKVNHTGAAMDQVIEGAYTVLDNAPRVADQVAHMEALRLTNGERAAFAEAAHSIRFPDADPAQGGITAAQLLQPRRRDDVAENLWTTFNAVQENVIRGGQSAWTRNANNHRRRTTTREVKGIDQSRALNRALWTLAERMAELKAA